MRKFVANAILVAMLVIFGLLAHVVFHLVANGRKIRFGEEVFEAIRLSSICHTNATGVILGDSVANQLFSRQFQIETTNFVYLASSQAIMPLGNHALLKRYLTNNPQTKNVIYMALPGVPLNDGAAAYTFHYMLYPFLETGAMQDLDSDETAHLRRRFSRYVFDYPLVRRILYVDDPVYRYYEDWLRGHLPSSSGVRISKVCAETLAKMNRLCMEKGVNFLLVSSPRTSVRSDWDDEATRLLGGLDRSGYTRFYAESQIKIPDEMLCDHIHFKQDVLDVMRTNVISEIFRTIGVQWP